MITTIIIPGPPIPLQRPRLGHGRVYDAQKKEKENVINTILTKTDFPPNHDEVTLEINFFMKMPKGIGKKKQEKLQDKPHTSRPDIDNLIKFYLDVCNGFLYDDDSQIYNIKATKTYCKEARTEITIKYGESNGIQK